MIKTLTFFTSLVLCCSTFATEKAGPTKALMHTFLLELSKLKPFMNSEVAFTSEKGKKQVGASLNILTKKMNGPSNEIEDNIGFHLTYKMLRDHIEKTKSAFDRGEYQYARLRLNGTTNFCISCHTQTPHLSKSTPFDFLNESSDQVDFDNATFLFVTRRYGPALTNFDQLIRNYPKNNLTSDQLNEIVHKKLAIFARIQRNPGAAIVNLTKDLKNKELPKNVAENMKTWIKELQKWKIETTDPASLDTPTLIVYAEKNIPKDLVRKMSPINVDSLKLLRLSGLLYERLFSEDVQNPQVQPLLYYLAIIERSLSPLYWYSASEVYLKECVVRYPKQSYSKKCLDAYRQGMEERFSGNIPEQVRDNIKALESY